ncbi:MAG: DEAD/DEAH box helicase, partial [Myxococcota bacterium]
MSDMSNIETTPPESSAAAPLIAFETLGVSEPIRRALAEMGFAGAFDVQAACIGPIMAGRDVLVQARTGSGKTAAFGIPLAERVIRASEPRVQALVLAPTRELALQVAEECARIGRYIGVKVVAIYGGAPMGAQIEAIRGGAQLAVGTPGRLLDHLRRGTLKLDAVRAVVLDECDEMLSRGFLEDITAILDKLPRERQTLLFSATLPADIQRIASRYLRDPSHVNLSRDYVSVDDIHHCFYLITGAARSRTLLRVLEHEKAEGALIFCNTRDDTVVVADFLTKHGWPAEPISSDLTQADRERVMGMMKTGTLRFLVATDIAARGIDI